MIIDPDLNNVNIISDRKLSIDEIENIVKIKKQNSFLKKSFFVIVIVTISIAIYTHFNRKMKDSIEE